MALMRRKVDEAGRSRATAGALVNLFVQEHSALSDFLYQELWEDGSDRVLGTVLLFVDGGRLKYMLNDKAQDLVAFGVVEDSENPLVALNAAMSSPTTDWRPSRSRPAKRG